MFMETEAGAEDVQKFVESYPYVTDTKIVEDYEIQEFDLKSIKNFKRISETFLERP